MLRPALLALALAAAPSTASAGPRVVVVQAVTDGDTLRLATGERVRLAGIDAPELSQTCRRWSGDEWACGTASARFLAQLVNAGDVQCEMIGRDRYNRHLAHCWAAGRELGREMLRAGMAVPYAGGLWSWGQVLAAVVDRAGIWSGSFVWPSTYRQQQRR